MAQIQFFEPVWLRVNVSPGLEKEKSNTQEYPQNKGIWFPEGRDHT
jgi:hypothetical protein